MTNLIKKARLVAEDIHLETNDETAADVRNVIYGLIEEVKIWKDKALHLQQNMKQQVEATESYVAQYQRVFNIVKEIETEVKSGKHSITHAIKQLSEEFKQHD